RMADQENLHIAELEAELLDAGANQWDVRLEIAVDEDVALRRRDEVIRQPFAADVIQIAGDPERRKWLRPVGAILRRRPVGDRRRRERGEKNCASSHARANADIIIGD